MWFRKSFLGILTKSWFYKREERAHTGAANCTAFYNRLALVLDREVVTQTCPGPKWWSGQSLAGTGCHCFHVVLQPSLPSFSRTFFIFSSSNSVFIKHWLPIGPIGPSSYSWATTIWILVYIFLFKKIIGILIRIALNILITLDSIYVLKISGLPIYECSLSFHLFVPSLISFSNVV